MKREAVEHMLLQIEAQRNEEGDLSGVFYSVDADSLADLCRRWLAVEDSPAADVQMLGNLILSDIDNGCLALVGQRVRIVPEKGEGS